MADKKLSQIDETTSAKDTDYIHVVIDDPATPFSRRIKKRNFLKANAAVVEKTADFTVTAADKGTVFLVESASPVTITLPDSATTTLPDGYNFTVKTTGNGAAALTKAGAADGINGNATIRTGQAAGVVKHGTSPCTWEIFGNIEISAIGKTTAALTTGNLGKFDANDNLIDAQIAAAKVVTTDDNTATADTLIRQDATSGKKIRKTDITVSDNNVITGANIGINTQAGAYTLLAADNNKMILLTAGSNVNITIPDGTLLPVGFNCSVKNTGTGTATVQSSGGDTLSGITEIKPGYTLGIVKTGTTAWHTLGGDLVGTIQIGEIDPSAKSGNGAELVTTTSAALTNGNIGKFDSNENLIDAGLAAAKLVSTDAASATDNALIRADGSSGKLIHSSGITVDDDDIVLGANVKAETITADTYTLAEGDNGKLIVFSSNSAVTVNLPQSITTAGYNCVIKYTGNSSATVASPDPIHGTTQFDSGYTLGIVRIAATWHTFGGGLIGSLGISDIDSNSKSGIDNKLITGTAGADGNLSRFNGDGDLVDAVISAEKVVTTDSVATTDNTLVRADGTTGKKVQPTGIVIDDNNRVTQANVDVNTQTGTSYELSAADNNKLIIMSAAAAATLSLPTSSSLPTGFNCSVKYTGNNTVTVTKDATHTINGATEIKSGYSLSVVKIGPTAWHTLGGGLIEALGIDGIASSARSGTDAKLITGTAGGDGTLSRFDGNGDLVGTGVAVDDNNVMTKANAGINRQTASYQLVEDDNNKLIVFDSAVAVTLTLPQDTTLALPTGFNCSVKNINTGNVTLQKQGTDVISGASTIKNGQTAAIVKRGTAAPHTWEIMGGNRQRDEVFTFVMTGKISALTYLLVLKVPFAGTILETVTQCTDNTGTATFSIGSTNLGGTANAVSTTRTAQAHSTNNSFAIGDDIKVAMTGVGSGANKLVNLTISIKYKRDL